MTDMNLSTNILHSGKYEDNIDEVLLQNNGISGEHFRSIIRKSVT